jgi:molybdopterin molybdotransferase
MSVPDGSAGLLSYDEALARVLDAAPGPLAAEDVPLTEARGRALAADVYAREDLPPFDNSAVDGYAIDASIPPDGNARLAGKGYFGLWRLSHTVAAGDADAGRISDEWAARVFTGAPLPVGADRVVMQEDAREGDFDSIHLLDLGTPGQHIRRRGSDIAKGTLAVPQGTTLDAGVVGLLAALNNEDVPCPRPPYVGIITTGDELVPVGGGPLRPGQIRNSNGPALRAAVEEAGGVVVAEWHAKDTADDVRRAFEACVGCDVIVSCGGVSVGAHDHVKDVAGEVGTLDFWRIAIKPGKPLAFGHVGGALFFGLPGNPVSSLVTFELFVRPILRKLGGHKEVTRRVVSAILDEPLDHAPGRREFVRARLRWEGDTYHATVTGAQGSHRLHSLLGAEAYLVAHEDRGDYAPGERLPALLLLS